MKIKIDINSKEPVIYEGEYEYLEGQSREVGMPSFYIESSNKSGLNKKREGAQISFFAEDIEEIDRFIESLQDARSNMINQKDGKKDEK